MPIDFHTRRLRYQHFMREVITYTPLLKMLLLLLVLWLAFSAGVYLAEQQHPHSGIDSIGKALYWGVAAFSTAGISVAPQSELAMLLGGAWMVIGSALFFGTIVATITTYFVRPMQGPHKKIIDVIEYNLEQLDELSVEDLDLLKKTVDGLIVHMEQSRIREARHAEADIHRQQE